jgi:PleD family two-component response regulator
MPHGTPVPDSISTPAIHRVLLIDDNEAIHGDFRKVLGKTEDSGRSALALLEADIFGEAPGVAERPSFEIHSAYQGQEGVEMARSALARGQPYATAFVDMRMPPGWDGLKTIEQLWIADPDVQVVICSAHADYDWSKVVQGLNYSDKLLVLRKPAEPVEILQCATALSRKWRNERLARSQLDSLEQVIKLRTGGLEAANRQLRHLATHDSLTGLPNRVLLDDRLEQAVAHADRGSCPFALMMCSLDRFKLVNESLGHSAGDELLREIARRLTPLRRRRIHSVGQFVGSYR